GFVTELSPPLMAGLPVRSLWVSVWPPLLRNGPRSGLTPRRSDAMKPVAPLVSPMMLWPRLMKRPDKSRLDALELPKTMVLRRVTTTRPEFSMPPPMLMTTVLLVMVALLIAAEPPLASPPPPLPRRPKAVLRLIVLLLITSEPESRPSKAPPVTVAELLNA